MHLLDGVFGQVWPRGVSWCHAADGPKPGTRKQVRQLPKKTSDSALSRGVMTEISWSRRIRIKIEYNMYRHRNSLACPFLLYNSPYTYSNSSYISCEPLVGGMVSRIDRDGWSGVAPISGWRWLCMVCLGKRKGLTLPNSMPTE